jgi:uncharacterized protein YecE (DUF72 family)
MIGRTFKHTICIEQTGRPSFCIVSKPMARKTVYIGTSGWQYKHWFGPFYPEALKDRDTFEFYARHFNSVEINNSFYHLPNFKTFESWRRASPDDFVFAVKGSRFITHMKKLKAPKTSTRKFFARAQRLEDKLGPVLFQLPPRWRVNVERLRAFLESLPARRQFSFEFRDHTWFIPDVYDLLAKHNAAFCIYQMEGFDSPTEVTADFVYIRLHGTVSKYGGSYPKSILRRWAKRIDMWRGESKSVYFYFNNDPAGHAVKNAQTLLKMVE